MMMASCNRKEVTLDVSTSLGVVTFQGDSLMQAASFRRFISVAALSAFCAAPALAFEPSVEVMEPKGVQYVNSFPATVPVTLGLSLYNRNGNCITDAINRVIVSASDAEGVESTIHTALDPVLQQTCPAPYSFDWVVTQPGSYNMVVTAKHGNDEVDVEEVVEFVMLAVEFPAPPSVANGIINADSSLKSLPGKQRGCVISSIADKHAKLAGTDEGYGPKGGPYDLAAIEQDVYTLFNTCTSGRK
jgi:hypothetical protein